MERLTIKYDELWVPREMCTVNRNGEADDCECCSNYCEDYVDSCGECAIQKCFDRLAEYEDTGLTPVQIREIDQLYAEKCKELAEYQKKQDWIPVSERLPKQPVENPLFDNKPIEMYLVSTNGEGYPFRAFWNGEKFTDGWSVINATAWMPLPEPYHPKICTETECPYNNGKECPAAAGCVFGFYYLDNKWLE